MSRWCEKPSTARVSRDGMQRDGRAEGGAGSQCRSIEAMEYGGSQALLKPLQMSLQPAERVAQVEVDHTGVTLEEARRGAMIELGVRMM